jgi:hypothetical protein
MLSGFAIPEMRKIIGAPDHAYGERRDTGVSAFA